MNKKKKNFKMSFSWIFLCVRICRMNPLSRILAVYLWVTGVVRWIWRCVLLCAWPSSSVWGAWMHEYIGIIFISSFIGSLQNAEVKTDALADRGTNPWRYTAGITPVSIIFLIWKLFLGENHACIQTEDYRGGTASKPWAAVGGRSCGWVQPRNTEANASARYVAI